MGSFSSSIGLLVFLRRRRGFAVVAPPRDTPHLEILAEGEAVEEATLAVTARTNAVLKALTAPLNWNRLEGE